LNGVAQGNQYIFTDYLADGLYEPFTTLDVTADVMVLNPWAVNGSTVTIKSLELHGTGLSPFVPTYDAQPTGGGETIWTYRAPITGNPTKLISEYLTTGMGVPIVIDSYAIDPINRHLWLHSGANWFKTTATNRTNGTVLKPDGCLWTEDANYAGNDGIVIPALDTATFRLTIEQILACIGTRTPTIINGVADASYMLPELEDVPWPQTQTIPESELPQFVHFPTSLQQVCQSTLFDLYGVGCFTGATYSNPNEHPGLDCFAPLGSNIYSLADNGLVVGIGIGATDGSYVQRSQARWGSAAVVETVGYSIIVRHKHLFVLYGHLRELDSAIYVGAQVNAGTLLGQVGTATNPGAVSHVHIELRSFGTDVPSGEEIIVMVRDTNGNYNDYGILANAAEQATNIYEAAQFFAATVDAFLSDTANSSTVGVTGLGKGIVDTDKVTFDTTTPPSPCGMPTTLEGKPQLEYCSGVVPTDVQQTSQGYRGFRLLQSSVLVPEVEPTDVTTLP
jgi:hypothetical protein